LSISNFHTGIQRLRQIRSYTARIAHDHGEENGEYALVAITNARRTGGGFIRYSPQEAQLDDGVFELLLVKKPPHLLQTLLVLSRMAANKPDDEYIRRVQTSRASITSEAPIPWCLDGEFGGAHTEVDIQVQSRRISVIQP